MANSKFMKSAKAKAAKVNESKEPVEISVLKAREEKLRAALNLCVVDGDAAGANIARERAQKNLMKDEYTYIDVREVKPSPKNFYEIDEKELEGLAAQIEESGVTSPIIVRWVKGEMELIDGERRTRAHKLLARETGNDFWYMIPAKVFEEGEISDSDAEFILHAMNIGQRQMSPMDRSKGVQIVVAKLKEKKSSDPRFIGVRTNDLVAEELGMSPRAVAMHINVAANLDDSVLPAYNSGNVTFKLADEIAKLPTAEQKELMEKLDNGEIKPGEELKNAVKEKRTKKSKIERLKDDDLKAAKNSLSRATKREGKPDIVLIAEIKKLIKELEKQVEQE